MTQIEPFEKDMCYNYLNWLAIQALFGNDADAAKLVRYFQHRWEGMN